MNLPPPLVLSSKQSSSVAQQPNGYSKPNIYNCIHCEEESIENNAESLEIDQEFSSIEGIEGVDIKDYRLCQDCVTQMIETLSNQINSNKEEIGRIQEQELQINQLLEQSQAKFQPEDFGLLGEREEQLKKQIEQVEKEKKETHTKVVQIQNSYIKILKEENTIDDEILQLEKEILDLNEQKQMQEKELLQVNRQIQFLENEEFLRDQFKIEYNPNMINGFRLTLPTKETYQEFNQGMGQLCLLFEFLRHQIKYVYKRIKSFECNGAVSKVERSQGFSLELYCKLSDQDTPLNKTGNTQRFHIPFEGLREFSSELLDFYSHIYQEFSKGITKQHLEKVKRDEFERRIGEMYQKQESKEYWDFYFSQILHHFDCILDACQKFV